MTFKIERALVVGAGTMGRDIAQWLAQQGVKTQLTDIEEKALKKAKKTITKSWDKLLERDKFSKEEIECFKGNFEVVAMADAHPSANLVIEAIVEDLQAKKDLFHSLDNRFPYSTIFATNTSSLLVSAVAQGVSDARKKQFIGLHFFNPATIMKLVEVIPGKRTDRDLPLFLQQWLEKRGKVAAISQDVPGFIVNKVARNFYGEAMRITRNGAISEIQEIDSVMREVGGFKMGPFELMDLIGVDVNLNVSQSVYHAYGDNPRYAPHWLQISLVQSNRLGKKTKQGFYSYFL